MMFIIMKMQLISQTKFSRKSSYNLFKILEFGNKGHAGAKIIFFYAVTTIASS